MNADLFFREYSQQFGRYPNQRGILLPQTLLEMVDKARLSLSTQDTIVVLYTGGTIGSKMTPDGLDPVEIKDFEEFINLHPELQVQYENLKRHYPHTKFVFESISPLDSGKMIDADRLRIIQKISDLSTEYKSRVLSFIVLHGTDSAVESACFTNNFFGDGSIPILYVTSQYAPGSLGGDAAVNFIDAVSVSHCNISGTYIVAARKLYHPADCRKQTDSNAEIFASEAYGFGSAGQIVEGGVQMFTPFTARGHDVMNLPYVPDDVVRICESLDRDGHFLTIPRGLSAWDIKNYAAQIEEGKRELNAVYVEASGSSNVTDEAYMISKVAASKGISTIVATTVPRSEGKTTYVAGTRLDIPGVFVTPSSTTPMDRRYSSIVSAGYAEFFANKFKIDIKEMTVDPLNSARRASSNFSLFTGIFTRGHWRVIDYAKHPTMPDAGFRPFVRSLALAA